MARGRWTTKSVASVVRPYTPPTVQDADPANGERVPRCAVCGMPETVGNPIYPGMWGYLRSNILLNLCRACFVRHAPNDPTAGDPLTIWEEVA